MININSIKAVVSYIVSLDIILLATAKWLTTFNNNVSNILAILVSIASIVITYYGILHLKEKIISQKLDNELKRLMILEKKNGKY